MVCSVLFCFSFIYVFYAVKTALIENELQALRQQVEANRPVQEKMILANQKIQQIAAKDNILMNLSAERSLWAARLAHLAGITIRDVWLTELAGEKNVLHIKGGSRDYAHIAQFMQQLEQDELFTEPNLVHVEQGGSEPGAKFEITVKLKGV